MSKDESSINLRASLYFPRADILIIIFSENKIIGRGLKILTFPVYFSILGFTTQTTERCLIKKTI